MKLQQLRTNLPSAASRVIMLPTQRPDTVDRKRGSAGVRDRERIRARDCGLCQECERRGKTALGAAVDHITQLWKGGSDEEDNKELLCVPCHDAKTDRTQARELGAVNYVQKSLDFSEFRNALHAALELHGWA